MSALPVSSFQSLIQADKVAKKSGSPLPKLLLIVPFETKIAHLVIDADDTKKRYRLVSVFWSLLRIPNLEGCLTCKSTEGFMRRPSSGSASLGTQRRPLCRRSFCPFSFAASECGNSKESPPNHQKVKKCAPNGSQYLWIIRL